MAAYQVFRDPRRWQERRAVNKKVVFNKRCVLRENNALTNVALDRNDARHNAATAVDPPKR
jgi:hypothetical protein